jgi:outer membrane protein OmpA-like peptidoglycan-associated protein
MKSMAARTPGPLLQRRSSGPTRTRSFDATPALGAPALVRLQSAVGNRAMARAVAPRVHQPVVQRKCAECEKEHGTIQPKLAVGPADDEFEREADRVAERVMRMPDPVSRTLQGAPAIVQRRCKECEEEDKKLQGKAEGGGGLRVSPDVESQIAGLKGAGRPLPASVRSYFEPRFGQDFGQVRLHTGSAAAASARSLGALAYTVGPHIVFGAGQYRPEAHDGRRVLAHELTHVVQQSRGGGRSLQRLVCEAGTLRDTRCSDAQGAGHPSGFSVEPFDLDSPRLNSVHAASVARFVATWRAAGGTDDVEVHGYASCDGPGDRNVQLSCNRAESVKAELVKRGVATVITTFAHGETDEFGTTLQANRKAIVSTARPKPQPASICGPDVTNWLISQVSAAKADPAVLAIKARLDGAKRVAASNGFSATDIAEGAVAKKVLAEEARAGSPARTAEARSQIAASATGQAAFGRALLAAPIPIAGAPEALVLAAIRSAALGWKNLVGTGKKYDFKNDPRTLKSPVTNDCPVSCGNTLTLCASVAGNCFVKDVPGNLFYAHVGRFVGWTELALQLGSQFAQLESSRSWDPPEDTRMIHLGFGLSDPLSRADLCAAINTNRSVFDIQKCENCPTEFTPAIV